jgi:hypothetical protein
LDGTLLSRAIIGTVLPLLLLSLFYRILIGEKHKQSLSLPVLLTTMLAPWTLSTAREALHQFRELGNQLWLFHSGRNQAFPSALETLQERIQQGRAFRTRRYDVFWPPNNTNTHNKAVLLFPGFNVPHIAYAEVASRLSDAGLVVVVASMEPLRFPHQHLGADVVSMQRIMNRVQKQVFQGLSPPPPPPQANTTPTTTTPTNNSSSSSSSLEWSLMGHSAGAFAAMHLFHQFRKREEEESSSSVLQVPSDGLPKVRRLVLWGAGAIITMSTDLSRYNNDDSTQILLVQATGDLLHELMRDDQAAFDAHFPVQRTRTNWISGGTHHGFASYDSTSWEGMESAEDNVLPYSEQQTQACALTARFLLEDTKTQ